MKPYVKIFKAMIEQSIQEFIAAFPTAKRDELMARRTLLKIGGPAQIYLVAENSDDLIRAVQTARRLEIPYYIFGGGSNLLVSDEGFSGVVIQLADHAFSIQGETVTAAAGALTGLVAQQAAKTGLTGFEWAATIPGTLGGAVYGNSGCFGGETKDAVVSVEVYDVEKDQRATLKNKDCRFAYRDSRFKHEPLIILKVVLKLNLGNAETSLQKIDEIMTKRRDAQPQGQFSAGCLFKNFEYADESVLEKLKGQFEIPQAMLKNKTISAGWLIDQLGLKGAKIGQAQISPMHGNFMVNLGGARAQDVIALSSLVKMKVRDELGILLEDEVQLLGF
jgi:UDP-N-acetylmuramate dehydrogenase